jgi:hypothetical protein
MLRVCGRQEGALTGRPLTGGTRCKDMKVQQDGDKCRSAWQGLEKGQQRAREMLWGARDMKGCEGESVQHVLIWKK